MNETSRARTVGRTAHALIAIVAAGAVASAALAQSDPGNLGAAIRSSGHPCAHVIEAEQTGDNSYKVRCNSGTFDVTMNADGPAKVSRAD